MSAELPLSLTQKQEYVEPKTREDTYILDEHETPESFGSVIASIQSILQSPDIPPEHKSHTIFKGKKIFYLDTPDWIWLATNKPAIAEKIKKQFYTAITPIAEQRSKTSGIPANIYTMIVAKESWFLTSCPAQIANNPLHMNDHQDDPSNPKSTPKTDIIGEYPTVEWIDNGTPYDLFIFKNIPDAFSAFEKLMYFWARLKYRTTTPILNESQCIDILVDYWKSGVNGDHKHFEQWLRRIEDRR